MFSLVDKLEFSSLEFLYYCAVHIEQMKLRFNISTLTVKSGSAMQVHWNSLFGIILLIHV